MNICRDIRTRTSFARKVNMGDDALFHCLDMRVDLTIPLFVHPSCSLAQHLSPRIPRLALPRSSFEARVHLLQLSSRGVSHAANARVYVAISRSKLVRYLSYISIKMVCTSSCSFVLLSSYP